MLVKNKSKQTGFTLVELIVVIIILGILSAVALPKFMSVTDKAYKSAVSGATGGLGAGVALFHAQWVANGHTGAEATVAGFGASDVASNASGWPIGTDAALNDAADCKDIWDGVMQSPPIVDTVAVNIAGADYQAAFSTPTCTYTFAPDTTVTRSITYNTTTGVVASTNP